MHTVVLSIRTGGARGTRQAASRAGLAWFEMVALARGFEEQRGDVFGSTVLELGDPCDQLG